MPFFKKKKRKDYGFTYPYAPQQYIYPDLLMAFRTDKYFNFFRNPQQLEQQRRHMHEEQMRQQMMMMNQQQQQQMMMQRQNWQQQAMRMRQQQQQQQQQTSGESESESEVDMANTSVADLTKLREQAKVQEAYFAAVAKRIEEIVMMRYGMDGSSDGGSSRRSKKKKKK